MIFGNWKPLRIVMTAIFFSTLNTLSNGLSFFLFIKIGHVPLDEFLTVNLGIHVNVIQMLPFLGTIIILILTSKTSAAPKAVGLIYDQSDR
jgi:simple sugar transport system permease protein